MSTIPIYSGQFAEKWGSRERTQACVQVDLDVNHDFTTYCRPDIEQVTFLFALAFSHEFNLEEIPIIPSCSEDKT